MREKEPQFTVTDRRKFTPEGTLRDDEASASDTAAPAEKAEAKAAESVSRPAASFPSGGTPTADSTGSPSQQEDEQEPQESFPEPTAEESAQQSKDYHASARRLDDLVQQANAGTQPGPQMDFNRLVQSLYMTAAVQMGAGTPPNEQPRIDILGARQSIDMLGVLGEKTKGNLTEEEQRLLQNALFDLRMSFLEITNAIASSAERGPKPGKAR